MKRIDLTIKLHATYARSAGMYASQIWSTPFIDPFSYSSTYVESNHSSVMRFLLGVRRSTCRRSLLHEVGQMPFKFYWFRSVIKFWNDSIKSDNPLFRAIFLSDVSLAKRGHACWSKDLLSTLSAINIPPPIICASRLDAPTSLSPFNVPSVVKSYAYSLNNFWFSLSDNSEDIRSHDALNRRSLTYSHWFKEDVKPSIPAYFSMNNLSSEDVKRIARFRLGSHFLEIEKGLHCVPRVPWKNRICKRCASSKVDDALHLLQECSHFNNERRNLLFNNNHVFSCLNSKSLNPNLIADFNNPDLCRYISNCMSYIDKQSGGQVETTPLAA